MNQEITYSPFLIYYLNSDKSILEISDQKKIWELIKQNYVVCDNELNIVKSYGEEVNKLPSSVLKQELQMFVDALIINKGNKRKTFKVIKISDNMDLNITMSSNDKIYFNSTLSEKDINNLSRKYSEIEVHNVGTLLSPLPIHKLKNIPTIITLEIGSFYDLNKILYPFLKEAKDIRIEDPFLPNKIASTNLWKLIDNLNYAKIKLVFSKRERYIREHNKEGTISKTELYNKFIKEITRYKERGFNIDYSEPFLKDSHRERWIFTNEFQIYIPGGLDFLPEDGILKKDIRFPLDVDSRNQIRIENRVFDVQFD